MRIVVYTEIKPKRQEDDGPITLLLVDSDRKQRAVIKKRLQSFVDLVVVGGAATREVRPRRWPG